MYFKNAREQLLAVTRHIVLVALGLVVASAGFAEALDPKVEAAIRKRLTIPASGLAVDSVEPSEIPGLYRVQILQGPVVYSTANGDYFIAGDLFATGPSGLVNLAEERRSEGRREALADVPRDKAIVFPAKGERKAYITVFTDVSCVYCQKLHREVPELNRRGVEVRYLAYPRQGIGSAGFRQLASAWCADDPPTTLTRLKNREVVDENVCTGNPIAAQFQLGQQLGVRGTPAIITPDGEMIPGFRAADDLMTLLGVN